MSEHFKNINKLNFIEDVEELMNDTVLKHTTEEESQIVYTALKLLDEHLYKEKMKKRNWIREITDFI